MNEGDIHPIIKEYDRDAIHGLTKSNDNNGIGGDNKTDDPLLQQEYSIILGREKNCFNIIKEQEGIMKQDEQKVKEKPLTLEKSLHDLAREKFSQNIGGQEEEGNDQKEIDYLLPYLEKHNLVGKEIDKEKA